jgi:hypothetical protein
MVVVTVLDTMCICLVGRYCAIVNSLLLDDDDDDDEEDEVNFDQSATMRRLGKQMTMQASETKSDSDGGNHHVDLYSSSTTSLP